MSSIWGNSSGGSGAEGKSAYQIAVANGYSGTEQQWLLSLKGEPGIAGAKGDKGDKGDTGLQGLQGLKGDTGATGPQGIQGVQGGTGPKGDKGDKGDTGESFEGYSVVCSNLDSNNIYTVIDYKDSSNVLRVKSTLSGGTSPSYTTRTVQYFDTDGVTVLNTKTYTITYSNGLFVSEILV